METNESTNHYLIVEGNLIWPGITRQSQLQFQPTLVSETTVSLCYICPGPSTPSCLYSHVELSKADDIRLLQKLMLNNTSPATLIISSMSIDGFSCQGYGYHINNCDIEFELEANSSKSIEIR